METRVLAAAAAHLADEKKAVDIRVFDVEDRIKVADYFLVCTGTSRPHVRAIIDELHIRLKAAGAHHSRAEGMDTGWWVLLDYGDVVVHVLQPDAREFYSLEELYEGCEELNWQEIALPELPEVAQ